MLYTVYVNMCSLSLSLSVAQSKSTSETTRQQPFQLINELKLNRPKISYSVQ